MLRNLHLILIILVLFFAASCQADNAAPNIDDDDEKPTPPITEQLTINPRLSFADIKTFLLEGESFSLYEDYFLRVNIYIQNDESGESHHFSKLHTNFNEIFHQGELAFGNIEIDDDDFRVFVWCDFLINEHAEELYSWNNSLEQVSYADAFWMAPSEAKDAYQGFAIRQEGDTDLTIYLSRPLAKFEIVANDLAQFLKNEGEEDLSKFEFELKYRTEIPFAYNVHEQSPVSASYEIPQNISLTPQIINDNLKLTVQTLFYIDSVTFDLLIYKNKQLVKTYENIYIKLSEGGTNKVEGDYLTSNSGIGIDPEFDGVTDVWID